MILLTGKTDSYAQFITVLILFVLVLAITALVTGWLADYRKRQNANLNVEVIETTQLSGNKYIQIVRLGKTYMALAVCKDSVTCLGEIPEEQLIRSPGSSSRGVRFRELLEKAKAGTVSKPAEAEDNQSDDKM